MKKIRMFYSVVAFAVLLLPIAGAQVGRGSLSASEIVDVLVSFGNSWRWEVLERGIIDQYGNISSCEKCGFCDEYSSITSIGNNVIQIPRFFYGPGPTDFITIKVEGPIVKFVRYGNYTGSYPPPPGMRLVEIVSEIEVISKTSVIARQEERGKGMWICKYRKK